MRPASLWINCRGLLCSGFGDCNSDNTGRIFRFHTIAPLWTKTEGNPCWLWQKNEVFGEWRNIFTIGKGNQAVWYVSHAHRFIPGKYGSEKEEHGSNREPESIYLQRRRPVGACQIIGHLFLFHLSGNGRTA